jgi:GH25 family lysozyme M1 (1,4-beta-N-acetylmuramidase)/predicted alpha/beta superfamily hydrolase
MEPMTMKSHDTTGHSLRCVSRSSTLRRLSRTICGVVIALFTLPAAAAQVCPGASTLMGVDVNHTNGAVDWDLVAGSGVQFALAYVSDGLVEDPLFDQNYSGIKAAGLVRGAVQFFEPGQDAGAQAGLMLAKIGTLGLGDLPPALDVEINGGQSPQALAADIQAWVESVEKATGRIPIIYTSAFIWNNEVASDPTFATDHLWIANLNVVCPTLPSVWRRWAFWQYSTDFVSGIDFEVNLDAFNGSSQDLNDLATNPAVDRCIGVICTALDQCHDAGTCNPATGACSNPAKPDGVACNDGNPNTSGEVCTSGACRVPPTVTPCSAVNPVCPPPDPCHDPGVCNAAGVCSYPAKPNGAVCNDGDPSTSGDVCTAGVCAGVSSVVTCSLANPVCPAADQCHGAGVCNALGICIFPASPDGTACNDGNACTQIDTCQAGACVGSSTIVCAASTPCHVAGACDPGTGLCSNPPAADKTSCDDGQFCNGQDVCFGGTCTHSGNPCVKGGVCDPTNAACVECVVGSDCQSGICSGGVCALACPADQVNCGGSCRDTSTDSANCGACGHVCPAGNSCVSGQCLVASSCVDGVKNGKETGVDCGGSACPACASGSTCIVSRDCQSHVCLGNLCSLCSAGGDTALLRVHYPAGGHAVTVRGSAGGLSWTVGQPTAASGDTFTYALAGLTAPAEWKPLLDDATWSRGPNYHVAPGQIVDVWPHFTTTQGQVVTLIPAFHSMVLGNDRAIYAYLPAGYNENTDATYPVVYMHDGQNLWAALPQLAFGATWNVDSAFDVAAETGACSASAVVGWGAQPLGGAPATCIGDGDCLSGECRTFPEAIVIGVANDANRIYEYTPTTDPSTPGGGGADGYVQMLAGELTPTIDAMLRTRHGAGSTAIAGSSLGGLVSAYAALRRPDVYGLVAEFSPDTWWNGDVIVSDVAGTLPAPARPQIVYVDSGAGIGDGEADTDLLAAQYLALGYTDGVNFRHVVQPGASHNEVYWAERFPGAIQLLLGVRGGVVQCAPGPATCSDGVQDGNETGIDCGGACPACPIGQGCLIDADCGDRDPCTTDTCVAHACVHAPVVCVAQDQCHDAGTCDMTGLCSNPAKPDGTNCSDGNSCTAGDTCRAGTCAGGAPLSCDDGNLCTVDTCNPSSGCVNTPGNAGAVCRASAGVCDVSESCDGVHNTCPADGFQSAATVCRPATAQCDVAETCTGMSAACPADALASNGTSCSDGNACTLADTCQGGACRSLSYAWTGVLQPINGDGTSIFKLGSTVPVKFQLTTPCVPTGTFTAKIFLAKITDTVLGTEVEATSTASADTGNTFRYDASGDQYIYNLATKTFTNGSTTPLSAGTWQIRIAQYNGTTEIGTMGTVTISLKK